MQMSPFTKEITMKNFYYYQMRSFLYPREEKQSVEFKLKDLEGIWFCTQKNVKRRLQMFSAEGRVHYEPGKGRGNPSKLSFKNSFRQEIEEAVLQAAAQNELEDVLQLLQLPIPKAWIANVSEEIQKLFGIQTSRNSEDILRTVVTRKLTTLDPLIASINFETFLIHQLGDSLLVYDEPYDVLRPHVAHHWEESDEGKVWTFYLRKGVRFHNGEQLTSEDVRFTFHRFQANPSPHHWLVEDIEEMECPGPYTVTFRLSRPNPFFPRYTSAHNLAILPHREPFDEHKWIGTGPFQMKKRNDALIVLKAFDDYFLTRPLLDEIEIYKVDLNNGSSGMTYEIQDEEGKREALHKEDIELGFRFLAFNFRKESIVQNPFFREGVYHLTDAGKMLSELKLSDHLESSSYFYWKSVHLPKDRSRVGPLLQKAGYRGETLKLYTFDKPKYREEAEWIKSEAASEGLKLDIQSFTFDDYYNPKLNEADILLMGEVASTDFHLSFIGAFLSKALFTNRFFSDKQIAEVRGYIERIKQGRDKEEREYWIEETENFIRRENLLLYLYHPVRTRTFHPMIKDIEFESFGYVDFRKLWIR